MKTHHAYITGESTGLSSLSFQYYSSQAFMPEVVLTWTVAIFGARIYRFLKLSVQLLQNRSTGVF